MCSDDSEHNSAETQCIHTIVKLYHFTNIVCIALKTTALTLYVVYSHSMIIYNNKISASDGKLVPTNNIDMLQKGF